MALRGISEVVSPAGMTTGNFYRQSNHNGGSWLFLRVAGPASGSANARAWDLVIDPDARNGTCLTEPGGHEPAALLPPVSVRVDPDSRLDSPMSSALRPGTLAVRGKEAFVVAGWHNGIGQCIVNLETGETVPGDLGMAWLSFSRWSLVIDEGDREIVLAHFERKAD